MKNHLQVSIGQYSSQGRKVLNQDFHGAYIPAANQLTDKGVVLAIADGISSSEVSHIASESAVSGFLEDYYATNDTWSVKTSAERVLNATNEWLYSQTRQSRYENNDQGYVCTFSGLILKGRKAHLFHVGDTRIYRLNKDGLEQLTEDHRVYASSERSYLARALGITHRLDIEYRQLPLDKSDIFLLTTDGVHEFTQLDSFKDRLLSTEADFELLAREIIDAALAAGSDDNLTLQIVRIDNLPDPLSSEFVRQLNHLPCPPQLDVGDELDGLRILREIRIGSRSYIYLAEHTDNQRLAILKTPSIGMRNDPAYLERFLIEDWIANRLKNPHIVNAIPTPRPRSAIYVATEYIEGQSLAQWIRDHRVADLVTLRDFMGQIARGLQAMHRLDMLHQDLKPENILIDRNGTIKIIDFGATRVASIEESNNGLEQINLLGSAPFAAPEYFLGETGSRKSDLYSLGVIAYQLLSGKLPYGDAVPKIRTLKARNKLHYTSLSQLNSTLPFWIDEAIRKAVHPDPRARYEEISEFIHDLSHANESRSVRKSPPIMERNPLLFWQVLSLLLFLTVLILAVVLLK